MLMDMDGNGRAHKALSIKVGKLAKKIRREGPVKSPFELQKQGKRPGKAGVTPKRCCNRKCRCLA